MFNKVFKRRLQGVSQGVPPGFYNVFIRCLQEVFTMCLQEIYTGGWYKAFQQCVYNTSTSVVFAMLPQGVYTCCTACTQVVQVLLQGFYIICTSVF
jgi:hypothetical protein